MDFEFGGASGECPVPRCLVAHELRTGRRLRVWEDELRKLDVPPYAIDDDALFVAFYASAELLCHLVLGWAIPANVLDLYVEFKCITNGLELPCGNGLLGALAYYGLDGIDSAEKEVMRQLAMRGGPYSLVEIVDLLDYCETDVVALEKLLPKMLPSIDLPRALMRGAFMPAVAKMEHVGVPIDVPALTEVRAGWSNIKKRLITTVDSDFGVFDGESFRQERFARLLVSRDVAWPLTPAGHLALDTDTFRTMVRVHPELAALHELRQSLSQFRLEDLTIGRDGRNRTMLSAFRSKTSRNQPSNKHFIFGPATWIRGFIRPERGYGLAYIDFEQQEWGIAAALSHDDNMIAAYLSGDAYLAFARQTNAVPLSATKRTHKVERERFKLCGLGILYGMEDATLATRICQTRAHASELLRLHRRLYRTYWAWSDAALDHAMLRNDLHTVFGWKIQPGPRPNPRSLRNFPVQANAAEMLRLACVYVLDAGVELCAPVHDAVLIHAPLEQLDAHIAVAQQAMGDASADVLSGFRLRTEVHSVRYPGRYMDDRGAKMWAKVWELLK